MGARNVGGGGVSAGPIDAEETSPPWVGDLLGYHAFDASGAVAAGLRYRSVEATAWDRSRPQTWPMAAGLDRATERALLEVVRAGR